MTETLLIVILLLSALNALLTAGLCTRCFKTQVDRRTEERVQEAMDEEAEKARRDELDEGFQNIMTYSVNGKTGFEKG